ncbi:MAG: DUF1990 domain-containing protein [Pyrinomonadaceae bacterium]
MFLLARPDTESIERFLQRCRDDDFSYPEVGASRDEAPSGYTIDHNRVKIGLGEKDFELARLAVNSWAMFDIGWVNLLPSDTKIAADATVGILIRHFGFFSLNAARVVYVVDETAGEVRRYGFAYGTLSEHGEIGEERFSVELNLKSGEVWYDLYAFSQPGMLLAKIGYPLTRYLQQSFARDSKEAMIAAVQTRRI